MQDLLAYEFIRNAIVVSILVSILCAVLGTFIVVKRLVFISGGISHAAFGGLGIFHYLGLNPLAGALLIAGLSALILGSMNREKLLAQNAMIGVLWATGMAIGILFIARTPGYTPELMTYLFGNILSVTANDVILTFVLVVTVMLVIVLLYKELVAISFDEEFAAIQGVPVRSMMILFLFLIAFSIVMLIHLAGIILVIAMLTIPPLIAMQLVRHFKFIIILASLVGIFMTLGGLFIAYYIDLPAGPVIIVLGTFLLGLVFVGQKLFFHIAH